MMTAEEPDVSLEQKGKEEHFPAVCVFLCHASEEATYLNQLFKNMRFHLS